MEDPGEAGPPPPPLEERLVQLRGELDELEGFVAAWRGRGMMGHNGPPEEAQLRITDEDLDEAQESIDEVRTELDKPNAIDGAASEPLEKAESRFRTIAGKLWIAVKWIGGAIGVGALKEAGKELMDDPHAFAMKLETAASTIAVWTAHIHHLL